MPDLEALGDAATGAVLAGAVEPRAGQASDGHTHETHCLNCQAELVGDYCHACGQHAHVHRTVSAFFHDFLHGVLHFEGKIWRTLPLLAWRPGELTRRYIDGQRARFISPIALFLFSVFVMFAAVGLTGALNLDSNQAMQADLAQEAAKARETVHRLETERARAVTAHQPTAKIDAALTDARAEATALTIVKTRNLNSSPIQVSDDLPAWFRNSVDKAAKNPDLVLYKLKTNAYKLSWVLIPLSVPFLWLLFPFSRRFKLYDHIVFVTYSLCFMTLLVVGAVLLSAAGLTSLASLAFFVPPFHMYRQLKGTYALSRFGAIWRTVLLTMFAFVAISLFVITLVALGLFD